MCFVTYETHTFIVTNLPNRLTVVIRLRLAIRLNVQKRFRDHKCHAHSVSVVSNRYFRLFN